VSRVLSHRERIEMIRRGMTPPDLGGRSLDAIDRLRTRERPYASASQPPPWIAAEWQTSLELDAHRSLRRGIMTALIGLAILIGLSFIGYSSSGGFLNGPKIEPGPWLLGGLIPMFVGIAQIIVALLSGARIPWPSDQPPNRGDLPWTVPPPPAPGTEPVPPPDRL
jgi:hypothetical protein